jgi:hypothetical protein
LGARSAPEGRTQPKKLGAEHLIARSGDNQHNVSNPAPQLTDLLAVRGNRGQASESRKRKGAQRPETSQGLWNRSAVKAAPAIHNPRLTEQEDVVEIKKANEIGAAFGPSRQIKALNWEVSISWKPDPNRVGSSFTGLNRVSGAGGSYPRIRLDEGTIEYLILEGSFRCNMAELTTGDYLRFEAGETMDWSSDGGVMFIVLKGVLTTDPALLEQ